MTNTFENHGTVTAWIGGESVPAQSDAERLPIISATTEVEIATLVESDAAQVDQAVEVARNTFQSGIWSRASADARKRVLWRIAESIRDHADELAQLETAHTGTPIAQSRGRHVTRAQLNFEFFAEYISQVEDQAFDQETDFLTVVRRTPVGVAGLIAPWNAPLALATMKIAGAIAFGNSCVLKPSELTPLSFVPLMEIMKDAGLPDGVVNIVNGRGHITGAALVEHPGVDVVCFTGGTETGRHIGAAAGGGLKKVVTELGGKSANIIFADADIDRAVDGALVSIFSNNGQQCLAGSRILLHESIADEFIDKFVARASTLKIGDPMNPSTEIGPLISKAHYERVLSYGALASEEGEVLLGGGRVPELGRGYFFQPTIVRARDNNTRICREEIFGPFASILTFHEPEEAFAIANDSEFGLVAYVWSDSNRIISKAMDALDAGIIWINTPMTRELKAPFGGFKASGVGRTGGRWSRDLYTEEKTITMATADFPIHKMGTGGV